MLKCNDQRLSTIGEVLNVSDFHIDMYVVSVVIEEYSNY